MAIIVLVVVPHEGRYLVVEELDGTWYLPAGKVERGENLIAAAVRETAEEAGVAIGLRGILGIEHDPTRFRFAFVGYLAILTAPKRIADHHTRGAAWKTRAEIARLPLRHPEVLGWIDRYEKATALLPCSAYHPYNLDVPAPWSAVIG